MNACFAISLAKSMPCSDATIAAIETIIDRKLTTISAFTSVGGGLFDELASLTGGTELLVRVGKANDIHKYRYERESQLRGAILLRIPFMHPKHVIEIVQLLRRQLRFNCIFDTMVRTGIDRTESATRIDINCPSIDQINCIFEDNSDPVRLLIG